MTLEESRLSMAWNLISMSARLCLEAGLHRLKDTPDDAQLNFKKMCFWHVYSLDKTLALNFGRTSNLPDMDITTNYPNGCSWLPNTPWQTMSYCFFDSSRVWSQIHEKLFSARAQDQDHNVREQSVRSIAAEVRRLILICKVRFPFTLVHLVHDYG